MSTKKLVARVFAGSNHPTNYQICAFQAAWGRNEIFKNDFILEILYHDDVKDLSWSSIKKISWRSSMVTTSKVSAFSLILLSSTLFIWILNFSEKLLLILTTKYCWIYKIKIIRFAMYEDDLYYLLFIVFKIIV